MPRNKSLQAHYDDLGRKADAILDDFKHFTSGIRVLFLIYRTKEKEIDKVRGDDTNVGRHHQHIRCTVVNGPEELKSALVGYLDEQLTSTLSLRVQLAVNERNIEKGIREFKRQQLEADYYDPDSRAAFYLRVKDRFVSAIMKPASRKTSWFLIDCDSTEEHSEILVKLAELKVGILKQYATKNGWHVVTEPFNRRLLGDEHQDKVHPDGLLLLTWR